MILESYTTIKEVLEPYGRMMTIFNVKPTLDTYLGLENGTAMILMNIRDPWILNNC